MGKVIINGDMSDAQRAEFLMYCDTPEGKENRRKHMQMVRDNMIEYWGEEEFKKMQKGYKARKHMKAYWESPAGQIQKIEHGKKLHELYKGKNSRTWTGFQVNAIFPCGKVERYSFCGNEPQAECREAIKLSTKIQADIKKGNIHKVRRGHWTTHKFPDNTLLEAIIITKDEVEQN